jgi:hypothetical protein
MLADVRAIKKPAERALSIMSCIVDKSPVNRLLSIVVPRDAIVGPVLRVRAR